MQIYLKSHNLLNYKFLACISFYSKQVITKWNPPTTKWNFTITRWNTRWACNMTLMDTEWVSVIFNKKGKEIIKIDHGQAKVSGDAF